MNINIKYAKNGFIIENEDGEKTVFQENGCEIENWANVLYFLTNEYGPTMGKLSEKRIYINIAPGNSNKKFNDMTCPLCDCKQSDYSTE